MEYSVKAKYLGNTNNEYAGFTELKQYEAYDYGDGFIGVYDDSGTFRQVKNDAFHNFKIINNDDDECFVTETKCAVMVPAIDEKPDLRYYINGHEVDMIEFSNVRCQVLELDEDGVKCDTIKFEVKFE